MILAITIGPQAIFLVVVRMAGHSLVGMDLLNMLHGSFRWHVLRVICESQFGLVRPKLIEEVVPELPLRSAMLCGS